MLLNIFVETEILLFHVSSCFMFLNSIYMKQKTIYYILVESSSQTWLVLVNIAQISLTKHFFGSQ